MISNSVMIQSGRDVKGISPLLLFFLLGSVAISYDIVPGISVAQITWALAAVIILCKRPKVSKRVLYYFGPFILFALASTLLILAYPQTFGYNEALKSCANLCFYFTCSLILCTYLLKQGYERLSRTVGFAIIFLSVAALLQYIYVVGLNGSPMIYSWTNHFTGDPQGWNLAGSFRAAGIFGEPSYLGLYIVLFMAFIMIQPPDKWPVKTMVLGILALIVSFSAAAYILMLILILLQFPRVFEKITTSSRIRLLLSTLLVMTIITIIILGPALRDVIVERLSPSSLIAEGSFRDRIVGSWELAFVELRESPFIGIGLGNSESFYQVVAEELRWKANPTGIHASAIAYILGTTGIIGLALILYPVFQTLRKASHGYGLFIYFVIFWLTFLLLWNMFLAVPFWLFLILGLSILPLQKKIHMSIKSRVAYTIN